LKCLLDPTTATEYATALMCGWGLICRPLVERVVSFLRAGGRHGRRRGLLAAALRRIRHQWKLFYTVQSPQDEARLRGTGTPWPTGETRAHLGPGVYAWEYLSDAREYRGRMLRLCPEVRILRFAVLRRCLKKLHTIDVGAMDDPDAWMDKYSLLGRGPVQDHGAMYIRRPTAVPRGRESAIEHFFSTLVFRSLCFCRGTARAQ
jgi:hypothetical protein